MLLHGGYWRPDFDLSLEREVAAELGRRGLAVWNVDYAAADLPWPATFEDVASALDHLRTSQYADRINLDRVGVVGHSAGGHLALWLGSRDRLPAGAPGEPAADSVPLKVAVAQAPVADLHAAAEQNLGGGAAQDLLDGSPEEVPERYEQGSPQALLPVEGVRLVLVHGGADDVVPLSQSQRYAKAAGAAAELVVLDGVGHFEHLDPSSPALDPVYAALDGL
jgi:acetyl esterase/lipase